MEKIKVLVFARKDNMLALEAVFESPGYQLIFASSGEEALKCLAKDDFAVIILDEQISDMDGFETARLIRAREKNKVTPIIFITAAYQTVENMVQGCELGAIDFMFKPLQPEALRLKIEAFVKIHLHENQIRRQNKLLRERAEELEIMNKSLESTSAELRKAEALARVIGETSLDTLITLDGSGCILNINPAVREMFGYEQKELLGAHVSLLFVKESMPALFRAKIQGKDNKVLDVMAKHRSGVHFPVEVQVGKASFEEQQIFVWSVRDITERKQLEEERKDQYQTLEKLVLERTRELFRANQRLRETSLKLTNILESITDAFFSLDLEWKFIFANKEAEKFWLKSKDELIGRNIWGLFSETIPEYYDLFQTALNTKEAAHCEVQSPYCDAPYEVFIYPSGEGLSVYFRNISERKMFEQEMARLDRLNIVGQMAAGIGHEVRNPMTTVRGFLQLLGDKEEIKQYRGYFELMVDELDRANSIISEFLSLAKNKPVDLKPMSLNKMIENMLPLIRADAMLSDKEINIELQDIGLLPLDEKEIRQLILNLVRNGLEAMSSCGKLTVKTFLADGGVPVFTVEDEGCGIKEEILEKIGTPFFTTKENGTGLGLATCFSIAARHNAEIKINTGSSGTVFYVQFNSHKSYQ